MARLYNGTNDVINCGSAATLDDLDPFTWTAWINPSSSGQGGFGVIVSKGTSTGQKRWLLNNTSGSGSSELSVTRATTDGAAVSAVGTVTFNVWQHVAAMWGNATAPKQYLNGVEVTYIGTPTAGAGAVTSDASGNLLVGDWTAGGGTGSFAGSIGPIHIYNAFLTPEEVKMDMLGALIQLPTLRLWLQQWGLSSPEPDWSGNANHGVLTGTTRSDHPPGISAVWLAPQHWSQVAEASLGPMLMARSIIVQP